MNTAVPDAQKLQKVSNGVEALNPQARQARWAHLSLCLLDATYSIGLRYHAVVNPLVRRYAASAEISPVLFKKEQLQATLSPRAEEQTLSDFLTSIEHLSDEEFAKELKSKNRTSSRGGILKSAAVRQIARVLVNEGVETLADVASLLSDLERTAKVESHLERIKGSGTQGIRTGYIWMSAGDDSHVKPDRHVLKWLRQTLGHKVSVAEARILLTHTAQELGQTPWAVDHAIWKVMARPRK